MKKRLLSLLLVLGLLAGLLPMGVLAEDDATLISTAEELAALGGTVLSGDYRLDGDIDMTGVTMVPISSLSSGSFDGGGHTVSNLTITASSGHAGLFAALGGSATIRDLILEDCAVTSTASSYNGTGALVGWVNGASSTISGCGVLGGAVTNQKSSSYTGGLLGYANSVVTLENCFSTATIIGSDGSSSRAGGLVGSCGYNVPIKATNCYAQGRISAGSSCYLGGLIGYAAGSSYSNPCSFTNCYSAMVMEGGSSFYSCAFAYCSNNYCTFSNCYYDAELCSDRDSANKNASSITALSTETLQGLAYDLGEGFKDDEDINNGYPILSWQDGAPADENATYTVTLSIAPKEATLTWDGQVQAAREDGVYSFSVKAGDYDYTVSYDEGDYAARSGNVNVSRRDVARAVTLEPNTHALTFLLTPNHAALVVMDSAGNQLAATEGTTYTVVNGLYFYGAQAFGYEDTIASVMVSSADVAQSVTLSPLPAQQVAFVYSDLPDGGGAVENPSLTVSTTLSTGEQIMEPTNGMTWSLPLGYDYTYTFKSANYTKVTGTLALSDVTEGGSRTVTLPLEIKTAWGGADDILRPSGSGSSEAPYQISTGAELAWLAQEVNAGRETTCVCVLTRDIDLGDEAWTPIGRTSGYSSNYAFKGILDGQGHTVKGLYVKASTYDQGLFGYAYNATLRNLGVEGSVTGEGGSAYSGGVGGIAGTFYSDSSGEGRMENCVNRSSVTGGTNVGGLVGIIGGGGPKTIQGCVNLGSISGNNNVGGLVGNFNYTCTLTDSYNRGSVTATVSAAGGVAGQLNDSSAKVVNCYTTGAVTASQSAGGAIGRIGTYGGSVENTYYLDTLPTDAYATAKTEAEMATDDFANLLNGADRTVWTRVENQNDGHPILVWQAPAQSEEPEEPEKPEEPDEPVEPDKPILAQSAFDWLTFPGEGEEETTGAVTSVLRWTPLPDVQSYDITLWAQYFTKLDTPVQGEDPTYGEDGSITGWEPSAIEYAPRLEKSTTLSGVTGVGDGDTLIYDLVGTFRTLPDRRYYATVVPSGTSAPTLEYVEEHVVDYATPYDRLKSVVGLRWEGSYACWDAKTLPDLGREFGESDFYTLTLYRQSDDGQFIAGTAFDVPGNYNKVDCSGYFAVGGVYAFTVSANLDPEIEEIARLSPSLESLRSDDPANAGTAGIYTVPTLTQPGGDRDESWVAITSAQQWMELANIEDAYSVPGDSSSSTQAEAWGKNYYLANDLDFSSLPAAWGAKTKSIGNVTHRFMGVLDGDGHKIIGLTLSNYDAGLFAYIGSTGQVRSLTIEGANILVSDNAAVLAHNNFGTIASCAVVNSNITADTGAVIGGMVSRNYGVIQDSYVEGGKLLSSSSTATGHAGFVGANEEGGRIERCWTSMDVDAQSDYVGGFVGLSYGATIRDCFALGDVSARGYSGGFAGRSVYPGNVYENCYAAGVVTVTGAEGHGFIGGNKPDSLFQYDQSQGVTNCWYNAASPADDNATGAKTLTEMASDDFAQLLNGAGRTVWERSVGQNDALPYLQGVKAPTSKPPETITLTIAIAGYDKTSYAFAQLGETISVTMESSGNTRVVDVMDAAQDQGLLTYSYDTTPTFGRYVHTINGKAVEAPDGWMFTVNDALSSLSASLATVRDGDRVLWFEGTTQNRFLPPLWEDLSDSQLDWEEIGTVEELLALANVGIQARLFADADPLSLNYRLTANLDLSGVDFPGIGSAQQPFTGIFHGQGHTVSNLTRTGTENVGFINVLRGGTVKELTLTNVSVTGERNVGALVGLSQAALEHENMADNVASLVGRCAVEGGSVTGNANVGGLVGLSGADVDYDADISAACSIDRCVAHVTVSGSGDKIGGLVGANQGNVTRSSAAGEVDAPAAAMVGGLAGDNSGGIYDSSASGSVSGGDVTGGLVGASSGSVQRVYALGDVQGNRNVGGLAGTLSQADTAVAAGAVIGEDYVGALAGSLSGQLVGVDSQITVKNVYANCVGDQKVVGNSSQFQGDSNANALGAIKLESQETTQAKLQELFGLGDAPGVPGGPTADYEALMDAIAQRLTTLPDGWVAMDLALYSTLPGKSAQLTTDVRQTTLDAMIAEANSERATAGDRARLEITLRAMGVDSKQLYGAGSSTAIDNASKLSAMDLTAGGYYPAPWLILAERQGNVSFTSARRQSLLSLLQDNMGDGLFGYTWDGESFSDPDTAGAVLAALAPYYGTDPQAKAMVDTILSALSGAMDASGSYGSANSDAMVIIGLVAMGLDPADWKATSGQSVVDGLLSYVNDGQDGFTYESADNLLATEQGFRALVALSKFQGEALDIYDFSATPVIPGYATGSTPGSTPSRPNTPSDRDQLQVTLTLRTDTETWINTAKLDLASGSTVYHALKQALEVNNMTAQGLEKGYIKSVTKNGVTLAEFDRGPNSGWLYHVNGRSPTVSLLDYVLKNGDDILWYYATDYSQSASGVGSAGGSGEEDSPAAPATTAPDFADTAGHWASDAITFVTAQGLFQGVGEGRFDPDGVMSRAMLATVLFRLADASAPAAAPAFSDVAADAWYTQAVGWCSGAGVAQGDGEGRFLPDASITREQLVTMLYRYAKTAGGDVSASAELGHFVDSDHVSPYAWEAMAWAVSTGLIQGKDGGRLDSAGTATRAEVATVLQRLCTLFDKG